MSDVTTAVHVRICASELAIAADQWLAERAARVHRFQNVYAACAFATRAEVEAPDLVLLDADWMKPEHWSLATLAQTAWPQVRIVAYGSLTMSHGVDHAHSVHTCGDEHRLRALLDQISERPSSTTLSASPEPLSKSPHDTIGPETRYSDGLTKASFAAHEMTALFGRELD